MRKIKKINFIVPWEKDIAGGIKRIITQACIINNSNKLLSANLIFLKKKSTSKWINSIKNKINYKNKDTGWNINEVKAVDQYNKNYEFIDRNTKISKNLNFNKDDDFIIFPEIFAHFAQEICIKKNIKYAIIVLNNFTLFSTNNVEKINYCCNKAEFIISGSKMITEYLKFAFPKIKKIHQSVISIDKKIFSRDIGKNKIITYMPRKLKSESSLLLLYLKKNIPKDWKIIALENMTEKQISLNLNKSKIFLSFSELEGLGRPPLEAAVAGNKVIGYHGQGGKEYMKEPVFTIIEKGNILKFVKTIIQNIDKNINKKKQKLQIKKLLEIYSKKNEIKTVKKYLKFIKAF